MPICFNYNNTLYIEFPVVEVMHLLAQTDEQEYLGIFKIFTLSALSYSCHELTIKSPINELKMSCCESEIFA